jgi:hypothetical protein
VGLNDLLRRYREEARSFRALLTDSEGQHVYPMVAPDGTLRYAVIHMPEGDWNAVEVLRRVKTLLLHLAGEARGHKDPGAAAILERCASMLEAVIRYHLEKGGKE